MSSRRMRHLFITDIRCAGLPEMNAVLKRTDAYVVFVADPADIVRIDQTKTERLLRNLGLTRNKTKWNKKEGTEVKSRDGWPRTPVARDARDPDWGDYEVHLKIRKPPPPPPSSSPGAPSAAAPANGSAGPKNESLGPGGAMLYLTVMNYDGAGDALIGTVALSLPALCGEGKAGFGGGVSQVPSRESLVKEDSGALPFETIEIDEPIVRYGKERGRLSCSILPWDLEDGSVQVFSERRAQKNLKAKRDCVIS